MFKEYSKKALSTFNFKSEIDNNKAIIINSTLGLAGESFELTNEINTYLNVSNFKEKETFDYKNIKKEIGDCFYYLTIFSYLTISAIGYFDITFDNYNSDRTNLFNLINALTYNSCCICEHIKKFAFHGNELDKVFIAKYATLYLFVLLDICTIFKFDVKEILKINSDRLAKRYPNGYSIEDSLNRVD